MEGQQKETQYPGKHKDTTRKVLWSGEDDEVSWGDGCLRKYRDDRKLTRSASFKQYLIVTDDFDAG